MLKSYSGIPTRIKLILKSWSSPESVEMLHQCPKDACSSAWWVTTAHLWFKRLLGSWSAWFETELILLRWGTHKTPCGKMVCEALGGEGWESEKTYRRSLALPSCVILDESCKHLEPQFPLCQMEWIWVYLPWSPHCETLMRQHMWRGNRKPAVYTAKEDSQGSPVWFEMVSTF